MLARNTRSIRRYQEEDYDLIKLWFLKRGIDPPLPEELTDTGFIADERAVGFLYLTNGSIALLDGVITDPDTVPSLRRASLFKLLGCLTDFALCLGYRDIFGITSHPSIIENAKRLGGRVLDKKVVHLRDYHEEE